MSSAEPADSDPERADGGARPREDRPCALLRRAARARAAVRLRIEAATGRCQPCEWDGLADGALDGLRRVVADPALAARLDAVADDRPATLAPGGPASPLLERLAALGYPCVLGLAADLADDDRLYVLVLAREPFGDGDVGAVEAALSQLRALYRVSVQCRSQRRRIDLMQTIIDNLDVGVAAVARTGTVLMASRRTRRLFQHDRVLRLIGVQLTARAPADAAALRRAIVAAVDQGATSGLILGAEDDDGESRTVAVRPIVLTGPEGSARVAAVFVSPDDRALASAVYRLTADYGLTPAERRLVAQLATGASLDQAAATVGIRPQTARTYLKHVYAKLGVQRQSELVAWVHARRQPFAGDGDDRDPTSDRLTAT